MRLTLILFFFAAGAACAQESFVTVSAHVAVPQHTLEEYSREGPGVACRLNYSLSKSWMAVAMVGINEFRPINYMFTTAPGDVLRRDAKVFPLQGGIRLNVNKDKGRGQLYISTLGGVQLVRLQDNNPSILYVGRYHNFNGASEIGYKLGRIDFNGYFNWGGFSRKALESRYFTLGVGVNLYRPGV